MNCSICWENKSNMVQTNCNHIFCTECSLNSDACIGIWNHHLLFFYKFLPIYFTCINYNWFYNIIFKFIK